MSYDLAGNGRYVHATKTNDFRLLFQIHRGYYRYQLLWHLMQAPDFMIHYFVPYDFPGQRSSVGVLQEEA